MSKFAKPILIGCAVVAGLFAVILLCINVYLQSGSVQQKIREAAESALGATVTIKSASYTPWSGLNLGAITVANPQAGKPSLLEAKKLSIRFELAPLLKNRFVITEVALIEPTLTLQKPEGDKPLLVIPGLKEVPEVIEPRPPATSSTPDKETPVTPPPISPKPMTGPVVEIQHFRIKKASVAILDAKGIVILRLRDGEAEGVIAPDGSATGSARISECDIPPVLHPKNIKTSFTWKNSVLTLPDIKATLADGEITGSYELSLRANPVFSSSIVLSKIQLRQLAMDMGIQSEGTQGWLEGKFALGGDIRNPATFAGDGSFFLAEAQLEPVDFIRLIGDKLNIDELKLLKLKTARLLLSVREERVHLNDAVLESENLVLDGNGQVRFNGKLELKARLLVNAKLQKQLGPMGKKFTPSDKEGYKQLPFTVTGRLERPKTDLDDKLLGVDIEQDLSGILKNLFFRPQGREKETPKEADAPPLP